jgi:hypothetical protein
MLEEPTFAMFVATATSDAVFKLATNDIWFDCLDIFIYDQSAYIGDISGQGALILANDIYYPNTQFGVNLNDFFFKNVGAGLNTRIVAIGILMADSHKKQLGIPIT